MNKLKLIIGFLGLLLNLHFASAQPPVIKAEIDSLHIMIGEQTRIRLEIAANKDQMLQLPFIPDTLMHGVEVLDISGIDTTDLGNNRLQYKYNYAITSFDSAVYLLPPFKVIAGSDTAYSKELALKVSTIPVDMDHPDHFFDIKNIRKPKFLLKDYLPIMIYALSALIIIAIVAYIIYRMKKQKPLVPFKKEEPYVPPHVVAIRKLDDIKLKKLWQGGRIKEYHSDISDTLRDYIEKRFNVNAMEMTSGETLAVLKGVSEVDTAYDSLKQILQLADFVKFAKYKALPDENELSLMNAYIFVNNTKPAEITEIKPEEIENKE
jgi:hypothetical protein